MTRSCSPSPGPLELASAVLFGASAPFATGFGERWGLHLVT